MAWLFGPRGNPAQSDRVSAVLARSIAVQERAGQAADDLVVAASESRKRTEAAQAEIRDNIKHRATSSGKRQASDVRLYVEELLARPSLGGVSEQEEGS